MKIIGGNNIPPPGGSQGPPGSGGRSGKPEQIKIDAKCTICGSLYDFGKLEVIQEEEGATLMYIKCSVCQSAALSIVAIGSFGIKVSSVITDLEKDEVMHFQEERSVQSEDVLALHEELEITDNFLEEIN
ncbi:MAG: hypothetical protein ACNFW9_00755 [Candidatus Kerfeldbacteria bacterium]|jgi:hypothetical protein